MRHLVYLLLVVNLVYFGWNVFESSSTPEQARHLPPLPATVSHLVTLQERQAEEEKPDEASVTDELSSIEDLTTEQPPGAGVAMQCQALGPFLAAKDLQEVESRLLDLGLQPTQRELENKELTGYWVYLPAMPQGDVQAALAILKKNKDKEYYVGKKNFISLGTFKGVTRAERRLKQAREMGLEAVLEERFTTQSAWWLDIQSDGAAAEQLSGIVASRPELQLVELACY
jgi:hypothetical protein